MLLLGWKLLAVDEPLLAIHQSYKHLPGISALTAIPIISPNGRYSPSHRGVQAALWQNRQHCPISWPQAPPGWLLHHTTSLVPWQACLQAYLYRQGQWRCANVFQHIASFSHTIHFAKYVIGNAQSSSEAYFKASTMRCF